jgi:hypothetical protein
MSDEQEKYYRVENKRQTKFGTENGQRDRDRAGSEADDRYGWNPYEPEYGQKEENTQHGWSPYSWEYGRREESKQHDRNRYR